MNPTAERIHEETAPIDRKQVRDLIRKAYREGFRQSRNDFNHENCNINERVRMNTRSTNYAAKVVRKTR